MYQNLGLQNKSAYSSKEHLFFYKLYLLLGFVTFLFKFMPQFDTMTFFNQVFWLVVIVFNFYVVVVRFMLPPLAFSLKSRNKNLRLTDDPKLRGY